MIHAAAEELLAAGAVLDDLAPDERSTYDAHRASCLTCRRLEMDLDDVLADLALAAPDRLPPPVLLSDIRRAIRNDAGRTSPDRRPSSAPATLRPLAHYPTPTAVPSAVAAPIELTGPADTADLPPARRRPFRAPLVVSLGLAAVFGLVAIGLGVRSIGLQSELDTAGARLSGLQADVAANEAVMSTAMAPGRVIVALAAKTAAPTANAAVIYLPGSTSAWIVAEDLPATPAGAAYQLWYADAQGVHGLQAVAYDGIGAFIAPLGVDLAAGTAVMVTLEPAGGATGEPGPQAVFGAL